MPKELQERLVEDVLDVIISDGIDVAKKNYKKICCDYGCTYIGLNKEVNTLIKKD